MTQQEIRSPGAAPGAVVSSVPTHYLSTQSLTVWFGFLLLLYLCWLLLEPFLPAIAWGFALALVLNPLDRRLRAIVPASNVRTTALVMAACLVIILPSLFLAVVVGNEVAQGAITLATPSALNRVRETVEHRTVFGPALRWIDSRLDLPAELNQAAHSMVAWIYRLTSSIVAGSAWAITQVVTMVVLLFYFVRDGQIMLRKLRDILPWSEQQVALVFSRIADTIRVCLYGKLIVAAIQGSLGGLIFWWLNLPAPAFWALVMALLSVLPVLGAFVIWLPAAIFLGLEGSWIKALILIGWGLLIVHPVDNLLGPVLVGSRLRLHTLVMFFSVLGGMAAFGASGVVLGPVIAAVAVALFEVRRQNLAPG